MKNLLLILLVLSFLACSSKSVTPPDIALLKSLEGEWISKEPHPHTNAKSKVIYRVTSGGTAVEETLFPGSPHEMVSIYTQEDDSIVMTHYCALGNQPTLRSKDFNQNTLVFDFESGRNIKKMDQYINHLTLTVKDENNISHYWGSSEQGQDKEMIKIDFEKAS